MIWNVLIALLMAIIQYVSEKKKSGSNQGKALASAAAVGLGGYYFATNTDWGKATVDWLDDNVANLSGKPLTLPTPAPVTLGPNGQVVIPSTGQIPTSVTPTTNMWDVLSSWGGTGTAAVIGTTGAVTGKLSPAFLIGGAVLVLAVIAK